MCTMRRGRALGLRHVLDSESTLAAEFPATPFGTLSIQRGG